MNVKKYIGMDVHQETISIADLGSDAGSRGEGYVCQLRDDRDWLLQLQDARLLRREWYILRKQNNSSYVSNNPFLARYSDAIAN